MFRLFFAIFALVAGGVAHAQNYHTLPFSSTFLDCPDSVQNDWGSAQYNSIQNCEAWGGYGKTWFTNNGSASRINSLDNYPGGGGGKGFGNAVGDDHNDQAASLYLEIEPSQELWVRFYVRFPQGFKWRASRNGDPNWLKFLRFRGPGLNITYGTKTDVMFTFHYEYLAFYSTGDGDTWGTRQGPDSWGSLFPGKVADGRWIALEVHIKSGNPGILEMWVDGVHRAKWDDIPVNSVSSYGIGGIQFKGNQAYPENGGDVFVSFDDIAVTNQTPAGRDALGNPMIGPLGWDIIDETPPTVSSRVIPTSGTTFLMGFDEAVTFAGAVPTLTGCSGGATTLSYVSGSGTASLTFSVSRVVLGEETGCVNSYTQPGNGIEDLAGNDLASFSDQAVTNNSTQIAPADALLLSNVIPTSGTTLNKHTISTTIGVTSDSAASCRIGSRAGLDWANLTQYTTTGGTTHSASYPVVAGGVYQVCSRCYSTILDLYSSDACTSFSVAPKPKKGGWR
jgi:hypothetical protein